MQFPPSVRARGARWHIVDIRPYDGCRVVTLASDTPPYVERRLLEPFDTIEKIEGPPSPRMVSAARWRAVCREALAADTPPGSLIQARAARIELMPHQLEPAMAIVAGRGTRVLLADEVGLGKTIQAGLVLAELRAHAWIDRILVVTPAGLREQWRRELSDRFAIEATTVDARMLRQRAAVLPLGVNPWSTLDVAIVSSDFVKRAEVLPAAAGCRWDAVVVDEAHAAAGDSDRRAALDAIAARASYVLLLTATPHSGDPATFAGLCEIGALEREPLLVFRRRRSEVRGESGRRVHTFRLDPGAAEKRMYAALARYADAVLAERGPGACLALSVLHKRAFSSPWSLSESVARRLATRASIDAATDAEQFCLPLGDPDGERTPADEPPEWPADLALRDPVRDRRLLEALADASRSAIGFERKTAALKRLLRRARQPAIVFTEYRDTLRYLHGALAGVPLVVLHGGMAARDRSAALAAFEAGPRTVLLATDAAGEGLNLHRTCRLVVNLELPWNPMRLEQRIGRVDRIGQTQTTHAFHFVAWGTGEERILERLHARVARAQADIGAPNPIAEDASGPGDVASDAAAWCECCPDEARIARLAVTSEWSDDTLEPGKARDQGRRLILVAPDVRQKARAEGERLEQARSLCRGRRRKNPSTADRVRANLARHGAVVVRSSQTGLRSAIGSKALLVWRLSVDNGSGTAVESTLVAVTLEGIPRQRTPAAMRQSIRDVEGAIRAAVEESGAAWRETALRTIRTFADTRLARERAILAKIAVHASETFQPGLFDRRAERSQQLTAQHADEIESQIRDRIAWVERLVDVSCGSPALLLAVLP